jgi:hypothetical protein
MPTNLVSTIMQSLSSEAIAKAASFLGLEQSSVQHAIGAAVPGLLGGLANTASTSEGAQRLQSTVSKMDDYSPSELLKNMVHGDHRSIAESGWSTLSSLMGMGQADTLSSSIAKYAGFGQGAAKGLLGFLAPLVLGFLKREQVSSGLDAKGLANFLSGQRGMIERAMPSGFAPRVDADVAQTWRSTPQRPRTPSYTAVEPAPSSSRNWAYWLLPALILAGAALYLLPTGEERRTAEINQTTQQTAPKEPARLAPAAKTELQPAPVSTTPPAEPAITTGTLESDIVANIGRLRTTLQNMKDPASIQASLGDLKDISGRFSRLRAVAQQLTPEARKALAAAVASKVPDLNALLDRIGTEINNAGADAKPAMDTLRSDLAGLSKA